MSKPRHARSARSALAILLLFPFLIPTIAGAEDAPDRSAGRASPDEETEAILAPAVPVVPDPGAGIGQLILRELSILDPLDKGSTFTDLGFAAPAGPLTSLEVAKLEMARRAIAASRLAGTLYGLALEGPPERLAPAEAEAIKRAAWRAQAPAPLPADLPSGVGVAMPPLQESGPAGLSPAEVAKLAGEAAEAITPAEAVSPAGDEGSQTAEGDGKESR